MIYFTDNSFSDYVHNPYNQNIPYDNSWVLIQLLDKADFKSFTGNNGNGIFRLIVTKELNEWQYSMMDFIEYEAQYKRNIIAAVNEVEFKQARKVYDGHSFNDSFLRFYEKPVLVHTTAPKAYKQITECGCLKSWNTLEHDTEKPIGNLLGDPDDYSDYIMFNNGGYFSEIVVSSQEKGYIDMDIHSLYTPGARFYFDADKMAKDGLLVRDGAHIKVKDMLEINKYLLWTATPELVGLPIVTTPYEFGTKSDNMFQEIFNIQLNAE